MFECVHICLGENPLGIFGMPKFPRKYYHQDRLSLKSPPILPIIVTKYNRAMSFRVHIILVRGSGIVDRIVAERVGWGSDRINAECAPRNKTILVSVC